jgi:hypothetical protein
VIQQKKIPNNEAKQIINVINDFLYFTLDWAVNKRIYNFTKEQKHERAKWASFQWV